MNFINAQRRYIIIRCEITTSSSFNISDIETQTNYSKHNKIVHAIVKISIYT